MSAAQPDARAGGGSTQHLDPDELLTPDEAAAEAEKSRQTIYNWIKNKKRPLKATKPGREYRIRRGDLVEYQLELAAHEAHEEEDAARDDSADVHTPPQQGAPPSDAAPKTNLLTGRFRNIKPVPPLSREIDTSADFELLITAAEMALNIRRYSIAAQAAHGVNDTEWAEQLERLAANHENQLLEAVAPFSKEHFKELRRIVRTTPIENLFKRFEIELSQITGSE